MSMPVAVLAIADIAFRNRVSQTLKGLRWQVVEAEGGADALSRLGAAGPVAMITDGWLPDLEITEFIREVTLSFPEVDLISTSGAFEGSPKVRNGRRGELLYALRMNQEWDGEAAKSPRPAYAIERLAGRGEEGPRAPSSRPEPIPRGAMESRSAFESQGAGEDRSKDDDNRARKTHSHPGRVDRSVGEQDAGEVAGQVAGQVGGQVRGNFAAPSTGESAAEQTMRMPEASAPRAERPWTKVLAGGEAAGLPEFFGSHPCILEVCRRIRLVAARKTPILVQGPSGSGKELVARAVHRLSLRSAIPLVALNCAAIPESLLEAELFGHTKGAFTGAVHGRMGRIEAASGGTLFLDEIGELPLALQAKLLRFLEAGEIQRIGDNDTIRVDVRVIAASHQPLAERCAEGLFRSDLFYRLAVFLIETPPLKRHLEDVRGLAELFLARLAQDSPAKVLGASAAARLEQYGWPGNVRELAHVIERAYILADQRREITDGEIEFGAIP